MTPINHTAEALLEVAAAEKVLRDVAYVLKLTRRVKAEMTAQHVPGKGTTVQNAEDALVA